MLNECSDMLLSPTYTQDKQTYPREYPLYIHIHAYIVLTQKGTCAYMQTYTTCMHAGKCFHTHTHVCTHRRTRACVHTHTHTYPHAQTHRHRHTGTHTHIHTDTQARRHSDAKTHRHTDTQTHRHTENCIRSKEPCMHASQADVLKTQIRHIQVN